MRKDSRRLDAFIDDASDVHDGDSVENVNIRLPGLIAKVGYTGEVFPNIFVGKGDVFRLGDVFASVAVRIAGIDAPERFPRHRLPDGTLRSADEIAHERQLAEKARLVVVDMLSAAHLQFEVRNIQDGKYASRVVAEVWIAEDGKLVSVGERLLEKGLAYRYAGGTKKRWTQDGPVVNAEGIA